MNNCDVEVGDVSIAAMRAARRRPAVLKAELATLRSANPNHPILAFEGDDDKIIYRQWINRVADRFRYVNFPCGGKSFLLELRNSLKEDKTGLSMGIYFLIDRDFDETRGQPLGNDLFVTEKYSIENYLVDPTVINDVLEVEFHCHADAELKRQLLACFEATYDQFLEVTKDINRRLYRARRLSIDIKQLPNSLSKIASVSVRSVQKKYKSADEIVVYLSHADEALFKDIDSEFEKLLPRARYRGKFSLLFMTRWLLELAAEASSEGRGAFSRLENRSKVRSNELTLTCFASRSPLPDGFCQFISRIRTDRFFPGLVSS